MHRSFFIFFLTVCFSLLAKAEAKESFVVGKFQYTIESIYRGDTTMNVSIIDRRNLTEPLFQDKVLEIPGTVTHNGRTYRVTNIAKGAFRRCDDIESVIIGEGIEWISFIAFKNCIRLRSVSFPSTLRGVDEAVFDGCYNLCEIKVDKRNPEFDSRENCNALIKKRENKMILGCRTTTFPKGIKSIGRDAFSGCVGLEHVVIPEGVVELEWGAFGGCVNLKSISLPHSLEILGGGFFECRSLKSIYIPENVSQITPLPFGGNFFAGCLSLDSVIVDSRNKFYDSRGNALVETATDKLIAGFEKSQIVEGIREIAEEAFVGTMPDKIYIPKSVVKIAPRAFVGLDYSTFIVVDPENPVYDSRGDCNGIIETATGTLIKGGTRTTFVEGVTSIGESAFAGTRLSYLIIIPEGIRKIGKNAFRGCTLFHSVIFPASLKEIEPFAFGGSSVQTVCWRGYVEKISTYAFESCRDLCVMSIPEGTKSIGPHAFEGCYNLRYVSLPASLECIYDYAFRGCPCEDLVKKNYSSIVSSKVRPIEKARQK